MSGSRGRWQRCQGHPFCAEGCTVADLLLRARPILKHTRSNHQTGLDGEIKRVTASEQRAQPDTITSSTYTGAASSS